jgi:hypothetical protein
MLHDSGKRAATFSTNAGVGAAPWYSTNTRFLYARRRQRVTNGPEARYAASSALGPRGEEFRPPGSDARCQEQPFGSSPSGVSREIVVRSADMRLL